MRSRQAGSGPILVNWRRWAFAAIAITLIVLGSLGRWTNLLQFENREAVAGSTQLAAYSAMMRIGLVIGAISMAWDSLRRPARWLPPGLAAIGVGGIIVVAAQPRLLFAILPLFGILLMIGTVLKVFRRT